MFVEKIRLPRPGNTSKGNKSGAVTSLAWRGGWADKHRARYVRSPELLSGRKRGERERNKSP